MNGTEQFRQEELKETPRAEYDRPIGHLLKNLSGYFYELIREQLQLAKIEISQKITHVEKDSRIYLTGASVAYAGFLFVLLAIVLMLSTVISLILSSFVVGILAIGAGWLLMYSARKRLREKDLVPRKTMEILREDKEWMNRVM
jgi:VIT1/CCC1 family predicted Fe2+/Mn2+ transporter